MLYLNAADIRSLITMPALIDALGEAFCVGTDIPVRHVQHLRSESGDRVLLTMPAFRERDFGFVKLVTVFPENRDAQCPIVQAVVVAFTPDGTPFAVLDGTSITHLRTAATSALASRHLSRPDSATLLIIGSGALAPFMALGHCTARSVNRVLVWGRRPSKALDVVRTIQGLLQTHVEAVNEANLATAVSQSDIVCCVTSTHTPVLHGEWLRPGTFVDLVGGFQPTAREADDEVIVRSRLFVDTFSGALAEAGDIVGPLNRGIITRDQIEGELRDLVLGTCKGRRDRTEITLFKSVGAALEDAAACRLVLSALAKKDARISELFNITLTPPTGKG